MKAIEFLKELPNRVEPEAIEGDNTNFHFSLSGEGGGDVTLLIDDGKISAHDGLIGDPKCVVEAKASDLMKVFKKEINPMMALLTGKLSISSKGEMMKYASKFGLM